MPTIIVPTGSIGFTGEEVYFINSADCKLFFTGYAPTVFLANTIVQPATGSLGFTGQVTRRRTGIDFKGYAPSVGMGYGVGKGSLTFTGYAPEAVVAAPPSKTIQPPTGSIGFTGYESAVQVQKIIPATAELAFTGQSLTATQTHPIYPFFDQLQFTGYAPTLKIDNFGTMITNLNAVTDVESNYQIDDRTGFKIKVKDPMMKEYTGHMVRPESMDVRSEQEYARAKPEHHKGPLRPEPVGDERFVEDEYPNGVDPDDL